MTYKEKDHFVSEQIKFTYLILISTRSCTFSYVLNIIAQKIQATISCYRTLLKYFHHLSLSTKKLRSHSNSASIKFKIQFKFQKQGHKIIQCQRYKLICKCRSCQEVCRLTRSYIRC